MTINIHSPKDMEKLMESLHREVIDAQHFLKLYQLLTASIDEFADAFALSNTFWHYALRGLKETGMYTLCRLFETQKSALNLPNFLKLIKDNREYFSEEYFRDRLKDNPHLENLAQCNRIPTAKEIDDDLNLVTIANPLVKKIVMWRNNIYAHKGASSVLNGYSTLKENDFTDEEIQELIDTAFHVYNKYLGLFRAATWSRMLLGEDDYRSLLKLACLGKRIRNQDWEKEMAQWDPEIPPGIA